MFKQLLNELEVRFELEPDGPLLIKASDNTDPTRPDMEFVRTHHGGHSTVYLPGSSLKGAIRAHCEKVARTAAGEQGVNNWACNPLGEDSCGRRLARENNTATIYQKSCFVCRIYGNTSLGSRLRFSDFLPAATGKGDPNNFTEQRNGVAIDRLFGSAAGGALFQFEVTTGGRFAGTIQLRNFTLAQLGLIGLALRDLGRQRLLLGFAKSRGLGRVKLSYQSLTLRYPAATLSGNKIQLGTEVGDKTGIYGIGSLAQAQTRQEYGLDSNDSVLAPFSLGPGKGEINQVGETGFDWLDGVSLVIEDDLKNEALWRKCAEAWQTAVTGRRTA